VENIFPDGEKVAGDFFFRFKPVNHKGEWNYCATVSTVVVLVLRVEMVVKVATITNSYICQIFNSQK